MTTPSPQGDLRSTTPAHVLTVAGTAERFQVDLIGGLSEAGAAERLVAYGPNSLPEARGPRPLRLLIAQFTDVMVLVLVASAVMAGIIGELREAIAILAIVTLNAGLGLAQSWRAERALQALRALAAPRARVKRGGMTHSVAAETLVPGDLVLIEAGNLVPADLRLVEAASLSIDESSLTGESFPVAKITGALDDPDRPVPDRLNSAFKGTLVTHGRGQGIVVTTGAATELGRVAALLGEAEPALTPLQQRLAHLGRWLAGSAIAICAFVFTAGVLRGEPMMQMLLTAVSLAVAAIPEALPAVVAISLAFGARRLARQNALIRHLPAVETLGSVSWICADKTGTLTENRMRVGAWWVNGVRSAEPPTDPTGGSWPLLLTTLALNNDSRPGPGGILFGDPTEVALAEAAAAAGFDPAGLSRSLVRVAEIPFSPERGLMTTVHTDADGTLALVKGAPERVLPRCIGAFGGGMAGKGWDRGVDRFAADELAAQGFRVLSIACRRWPGEPDAPLDALETELLFLGLVGLSDPPRPEAAAAVATCRSAGITPVMITGDHRETAVALARAVGIMEPDSEVVTGPELALLPPGVLASRIGRIRVFARVMPEQKLAIVEAIQRRGDCVAMTGDGVNDAPALKRADIGIAMGRHGTDVARDAADLILLDDNFATVVAAVRGGRRVYDNIRKFIRFVLAGNVGEILVLMLAPLIGLPMPLLPIHILWINLVSDGLLGLALAAEPAEPGLMQRPPRPAKESVFARGLWQHLLWVGLLIGGLSLGAQAWAIHGGSPRWRTITFTTLALAQVLQAWAVRSERATVFRLGFFSNRPLATAILASFALQIGLLYHPLGRLVLRIEPLSPGELLLCIGLALVVFVAIELEKLLVWHEKSGPFAEKAPGSRSG